jgi:hypothetical protein
MARYDQGYGRDYGPVRGWRGYPGGPQQGGGYGRGFGPQQRGGWIGGGGVRRGPVPYDAFGRGEFGEDYPGFGGYPGGPAEGIHYQERGGRYGRPSQGRGYDAGLSRGAFVPEEAYRQHPELLRRRHESDPWGERSPAHAGYGPPPDEALVRAVRERIHGDSWLDPERIEVQVSNGVVTLSGEVNDFMEARYAWDDAWETDGVRGVINHLAVDPSPAAEDEDGDG